MSTSLRWSCAVAVLGLGSMRCVSSSSEDAGAFAPGDSGFAGSASNAGSGNSGLGGMPGSGGSGGAPPEKEIEGSFLAPVVTGKYVFSANPTSGRVAVIDAETYGVRLFNAGFGPKYLSALPGQRGAIVINELSRDTTLFHLRGDEVTVDERSLPVHQGANAWAISNDARFAVAWTQSPLTEKPDATDGSQTITVLDLQQGDAQRLTVGFHPTKVVIDDESTRAFVVNDDGISVVELGDEPAVSLLARVSPDPLEEPAARDVSISPDGQLAIVRVDGSRELRFVDLTRNGALTAYDLGSEVADVDLSLDGTLAVAALPNAREVVLIPVPPSGGSESFERVAIPGEVTSSLALSRDAELALLYQNGAPNSHVTILDLREGMGRALRTLDVKGPVSAAFVAPDAASAIVVQQPIQGSNKPGLFSSLPTLQPRSAKLVGTDAAPSAIAFDDTGEHALVTIGDEKSSVHGVYRVKLGTLQEDFVRLASPPALGATGIVEAAGRGFVAQQHPEGRITFVELETARARTITGFELAARILQ